MTGTAGLVISDSTGIEGNKVYLCLQGGGKKDHLHTPDTIGRSATAVIILEDNRKK